MSITRQKIMEALQRLNLPDGGTLVSRDMIRALSIESGRVKFVIEAEDARQAGRLEEIRRAAEDLVRSLPGVKEARVMMTAHGQAAREGGHSSPKPKPGPRRIAGIDRIVAVASGKGGVGKSTVASNLAVALARAGRRVGLLDADIYGPSQPRMMGVTESPTSPDGTMILPPQMHGVTMMSIGLLLEDQDTAMIWRGPMLMGALKQLLNQVQWGELDVLIVDMPPGTGDIQLSLCQQVELNGVVIVSTPQDVALLDARKALRAFEALKVPILGLIENMSTYICPKCGHEEHIFGDGGVRVEAEALGLPFLGALPLSVEVRHAGDSGTPIAATDSPVAEAYGRLARRLIEVGAG